MTMFTESPNNPPPPSADPVVPPIQAGRVHGTWRR